MNTFDAAFELIIGHEGGYVNLASDPGGETNFGISKRAYPNEDIRAMTLERAKDIYKKDFWDRMHCGDMQRSLGFSLFDAGVNCGVERAGKWVQKLAGVVEDGVIGTRTVEAAAVKNGSVLAAKLNAMRLQYCATLPAWPSFGKGWARRIADNILLIGD